MRSHLDGHAPPADPVQQARAWLAAQGTGDPEPPAQPEPTADHPEVAVEVDVDPESVARTIALRLLTARARTRHELREALARRAVPDDVAVRVLDRFTEVGLVDDAGFAQQWVACRQSRRHLSRQRLRQELRRKGVDPDDIDTAISAVDATDELEAARSLGRKKLATLNGVDAATRYRRVAGVLTRRGFSADTVSTVLSELLRS